MWSWIKDEFAYLHGTFHDSEVIAWSRFQIMIGLVWQGLQGVDVSPIVDQKYLVWYIIFSNVVNELLRRRKAEFNPDGSIK